MRKIIGGWAVDDPFPGVELDSIDRLADRAFSLFARGADPTIGTEGFMRVSGAITMLGGMEHHYANIAYERDAILNGARLALDGMMHEAIAFLNRMGQFYYFLRCDFAKRAVSDASVAAPSIARLMIFRHKHAAHRSLDLPRNEPLGAQINHQLGMMGCVWSPRPGARPITLVDGQVIDLAEHQRQLIREYFPTLQLRDHETGRTEQFVPERDCVSVLGESYQSIKSIVTHR